MKTIFKIYIMVVRHCAWQILSSLGAELLVAMLGPIGLQVYEKQVQALEAGALEQLVLFLIIMYNIDKPQERRKATGTGGIPPENIRLRRTLTTEYLQLSLCYGVRDRMSIETAGFTGWR